MILKNRIWAIGDPKCCGVPVIVKVTNDRKSGELVISEGFNFCSLHHYSEEELLDMLAILRKVKKEKREDQI